MHGRAIILGLSIAILIAVGGGCGGDSERAKPRGVLVADEPPEDFGVGVTVMGPAPTATTARGAMPARYIVQADWVLRSMVGPGVTERTWPPQTRQLTAEQVRRVWWELRDSGLLAPDHPGQIGTWPEESSPGDAGKTVYLVSYCAGGVRRMVAIDAATAPGADVGAARRLTDRLADLAWVKP